MSRKAVQIPNQVTAHRLPANAGPAEREQRFVNVGAVCRRRSSYGRHPLTPSSKSGLTIECASTGEAPSTSQAASISRPMQKRSYTVYQSTLGSLGNGRSPLRMRSHDTTSTTTPESLYTAQCSSRNAGRHRRTGSASQYFETIRNRGVCGWTAPETPDIVRR
jgi:hypothetical protein